MFFMSFRVFYHKSSKVNFTDLLYVVDNNGNEHELSSCFIVKNSGIFTKNVKPNIGCGFKIIKKNKE